MISTFGIYFAASAANFIISTAPIAKFGITIAATSDSSASPLQLRKLFGA